MKTLRPHTLVLMQSATLLVALLVFLPTLNGAFIWDDITYLVDNPYLSAANGLYHIWFTTHLADYWPASFTLFWCEWHLFGAWTLPWHLVSIFLHGICTFLLWRLLVRAGFRAAFLVALLFLVHPVNTEAVAWVFQQKTLLATALALAAALFWVRSYSDEPLQGRQRALALICFTTSLLAKPVALCWPPLFLLYAGWRASWRKAFNQSWPFFLASLVVGVVNLLWVHAVHPPSPLDDIASNGMMARIAGAGYAFWFYVQKVLIPLDLSFVYPRWDIDPGAIGSYVMSGGVVLVGALLWLRRHLLALALLLFYLFTLFPILGLTEVYFLRYASVADHWQYAALPAILVLVVQSGLTLWQKYPRFMIAPIALWILVLASLTFMRAGVFVNEETLWQDTLARNPRAWLAEQNLCVLLARRGDLAAGRMHCERALAIKPVAEVYYNLGLLDAREEHFGAAISRYMQALALEPLYAGEIHHSRGVALSRLERLPEALDAYQKALTLRQNPETYYNLGVVLEKLGRTAEARDAYRSAQALNPADKGLREAITAALAKFSVNL